MNQHSWLNINQHKVSIDAGAFIKHDGYWHRVPVLLNVLHKIRNQVKDLRLECNDGVPVHSITLDYLIDQILKEVQPESFVVSLHTQNYHNSKVTVEYKTTPFFKLVNDQYHPIEHQLEVDAKLFGGLFGRFTVERFLLAAHLDQNTDSFVIFQPSDNWINFEFDGVQDYYAKELNWYKHYQKPAIALDHTHNGCVSWQPVLENLNQVWGHYRIEVIAETDPYNPHWITEKTAKCLISGKPFLVLGGPGLLKYLRSIGFQTFNAIIDESYDNESNLNNRLDMICSEISRLNQLDPEKLSEDLMQVAEYNRINYSDIIKNI